MFTVSVEDVESASLPIKTGNLLQNSRYEAKPLTRVSSWMGSTRFWSLDQ